MKLGLIMGFVDSAGERPASPLRSEQDRPMKPERRKLPRMIGGGSWAARAQGQGSAGVGMRGN